MTTTETIIDNRKVNDLPDAKQSVVYVYLKRMGLNATVFEQLWQGYVTELPDKIKQRIGISLRAKCVPTKLWR